MYFRLLWLVSFNDSNSFYSVGMFEGLQFSIKITSKLHIFTHCLVLEQS